jgi:hypothetical protein
MSHIIDILLDFVAFVAHGDVAWTLEGRTPGNFMVYQSISAPIV